MNDQPVTIDEARNLTGEKKQELITAIADEARRNEVVYWGCSRAVLAALQRYLYLGGDTKEADGHVAP